MPHVEYDYFTGRVEEVIESLNRSIGQYVRNNKKVKVGITGRNPQKRLDEHLRNKNWNRMVVKYESSSKNNVQIIEKFLTDNFGDYLVNEVSGGGGISSTPGKYYVYVLLA